jgi:hypothetical protein
MTVAELEPGEWRELQADEVSALSASH